MEDIRKANNLVKRSLIEHVCQGRRGLQVLDVGCGCGGWLSQASLQPLKTMLYTTRATLCTAMLHLAAPRCCSHPPSSAREGILLVFL